MTGHYNSPRGHSKTLQAFTLINAAVNRGESVLIATINREKEYFIKGLERFYPQLQYKCSKVDDGYLFEPSKP